MLLESGVPPPVGSIVPLLSTSGVPLNVLLAGSGLLIPAPLQGNIFVDPQNVSGNAGIGPGFGTSAAQPLPSYAALVQLWGTTSPFITTATTLTFTSPHTDNSDPIVCTPLVGRGGSFAIVTTPTVVATGVVLAGTVAKSRAAGANSLLQTNLGASGAVAQLVVNTTHASVALTYKALGGNAFSMSQPLVAGAVPPAFQTTSPPEVDTWANGDSVNLLAPLAINLVLFAPTIVDWNATRTNAATLYRVTIFDPVGAGKSTCTIGPDVLIVESFCQRFLAITGGGQSSAFNVGAGGAPFGFPTFINFATLGGYQANGNFRWLGGYSTGFGSTISAFPGTTTYDADHIFGAIHTITGGLVSHGFVFLDGGFAASGATHTVAGGTLTSITGVYGGHGWYGSASSNINAIAGGRVRNLGATFVATFTAPALIAPGILLDNAATGQSHTGASPDVINSGIATTPANLDAAAGAAGFGGTAFVLGGAVVTNLT